MSPHSLMHTPPELLQQAARYDAPAPHGESSERHLAGWLGLAVLLIALAAALA